MISVTNSIKCTLTEGLSPIVYRGHTDGEIASRVAGLTNPGNIIFSSSETVAGHYARTTYKGVLTRARLHYSNPLEVDAGGNMYDEIPVPPKLKKRFIRDVSQIDYLAREVQKAGYDALIVRDVGDQWGWGDQYVVFDESQVKVIGTSR